MLACEKTYQLGLRLAADEDGWLTPAEMDRVVQFNRQDSKLVGGRGSLVNVQFREITSRFRNGCLTMLITACSPHHMDTGTGPDPAHIRPLELRKITVRSKEYKTISHK